MTNTQQTENGAEDRAPHIKTKEITIIIIWHFVLLAAEIAAFSLMLCSSLPDWIKPLETGIFCAVAGGLGGIVYCLRGVYLNVCVKGKWSSRWVIWHIIRPFLSIICGVVSFLLLKAGLILLDASVDPAAHHYGFYIFAFIAGLNVDKFLEKIEEVAQTTWGIAKSRVGKSNDDEN